MIPPGSNSEDERPAASPGAGEPVYLAVGKLRRPHGVLGEMTMEVLTDFPERLKPGLVVYVGPQNKQLHLRSVRWSDKVLLVAFEEFHTPEEGGAFRNQFMQVSSRSRPRLPKDEYYHHEVLGLRTIDESGRLLGEITEVLSTGANDVYVIRPESGPELLLPVIDEVILSVDLEKGEMHVHLLPGLESE